MTEKGRRKHKEFLLEGSPDDTSKLGPGLLCFVCFNVFYGQHSPHLS